MRLLRMTVKGIALFSDNTLSLDLFAVDRVPKEDGVPAMDVTHVGVAGSIFSQNVVGITGVNASGKTCALDLVKLVVDILAGDISVRGFRGLTLPYGSRRSPIDVSATFFHDGCFYLIESRLTRSHSQIPSGVHPTAGFTFEDETLWRLCARRPNRGMVAHPETFKANAKIVRRRHGDAKDPLALSETELRLLGDNRSVVSSVTGRVRAAATPSRALPTMTMPAPVVQAFDPSIERLDWDEENEVYVLKFFGERERVVDGNVARALLSRGTVYGTELVLQAADVLSCGGYLLVDEMEEALNRSLAASVIDLFSSPVTNPRGAQLVFTTHYPELLDVLHRKDCIYLLVRNDRMKTQVIKYSDKVDRIENKKSEVVLSGMVRGTMPRYPDVRAMREYVKDRVNE